MGSRTASWTVAGGAVVLGAGLIALLPLLAGAPDASRTIVLVARDMAFHTTGDPAANPVVRVKRGERVRIELRNEESGITHDFRVPALAFAIPAIHGAGSAGRVLQAPDGPGSYEYVCTPHERMMKGLFLVE